MNDAALADLKDLRREYAFEAISGALSQFSAASGFLARNADEQAINAFQRGIDFIKLASPEMKSLILLPIGKRSKDEAA